MKTPPTCDVSFAIACYNARPFLEEAIHCALAQAGVAVEVLLVDDGSVDGSLDAALALANSDRRIRVLQTASNLGPGGARNVAIDAMNGSWLAVLDADDLIEPERSAILIAKAEQTGADLIADDLLVFGQGIEEHRFLDGGWPSGGDWLSLERYFMDSAMYGGKPNPGFLKPMIRRKVLEEDRLRYNTELRIAEDDELAVRTLLSGRRYFVLPKPMYRYRKHPGSISYRLSRENAERMLRSETAVFESVRSAGRVSGAYRARWRALNRAVAFARSIDALKRRRAVSAAVHLLRRPGAVRLYSMPIAALFRRCKRLVVSLRETFSAHFRDRIYAAEQNR